jgi:tetratricopeptide (TPR) repeat protein
MRRAAAIERSEMGVGPDGFASGAGSKAPRGIDIMSSLSSGEHSPKDLADQTTAAAGQPAADTAADGAAMAAQIARARPVESPALVLARARVGGALFGTAVGLGRFRVLERLGGGGMGVVYAAYDPELDRGVALKTVHVPRIGRDIALAEAKALARLAHPNVVPVFDVGASGDHVYIVMELVRGETLRAWVGGKALLEILGVYRQAGEALAAAHAAGLVHRDFKPDNAIVGTDGRVRVVDFGLACEAAPDAASDAATDPAIGAAAGERSSPVRVGGTPRYMAPEQAAGAAATPAADQYSFGVSLGEALRGDPGRPVPRWVELVIERATAVDPGVRFPSMAALLRALGADPARIRRRGLVAAAIAGVVAAAFAIGRSGLIAADEPCSGGDRLIAAAWAPLARQVELVRIAALSPYGVELAASLRGQLDDHVRRWAAGHRAACLAHRRGEQSAVLLDRRMACLDRGRSALGALAEIAAAADARALPGVARAARALPDPDACGDVTALASDVEPAPPARAGPIAAVAGELSRARVQLAAGRADDARGGAEHAVAAARAIDYRPLLAEALVVEGHARLVAGDRSTAAARLTEAMALGLQAGSQALAVEAWARRAFASGTGGRPEAALDGFEVIDGLAARVPSPFARALLHNNVGNVELGRGHRTEARALFERALTEARRVSGPGAIELVAIRSNTALAIDDPERRDRLFAEAHDELARLLGEDHPDALVVQFIRANTSVASFARAAELLDTVCRRRELHAWLAASTAACWAEVADLRAELGDRPAALAALDRAAGLGAEHNGDTREVAGYRLLWRGKPGEAAAAFAREIAEVPVLPDEPWYRSYARARLSLGLGRALAAQHPPAADDELARALAVLEPIARERHAVAIDRRLARTRAELARVRAERGAPRDQVRALAEPALAWLRTAGAPASELAALQRLTGSGTAGSPN